MSPAPRRRSGGDIKTKVLDELRFLRNWIGNPLTTGAVAPSGPLLARSMAGYINPEVPGTVVELGPGTGVVTEAILERGISASRLVSIEYNPDFCALLRDRFPGVHFLQGDAYAIRTNLTGIAELPLTAIVSSLPLFTRPLAERQRLINTALDMLAPGAPFIQFSYALVPPVPHGAGDFTIERSNWILMNLPPARVWIYRRPAKA
ncbi:MAG: methyltransferase domain-containing protein [Ancalomicrobiaceae bacterium]|nr:methyltransferase domain-containing protein [Ancalomicrobiaceae bacterium]